MSAGFVASEGDVNLGSERARWQETSLGEASRRLVGLCVADRESAELLRLLFEETLLKHDVPAGQLTVHADRGGPMKAKSTAQLMADLGVTKTHSRPHTSNDNPFSECLRVLCGPG